MMQRRQFGRTALEVSEIGFGCGMVGGLMVGGSAKEQREVVAQALDLGINYFDTAPFYGNGQSETHLGRALHELGRTAIIGTKVRVDPALRDDPERLREVPALIVASAEQSLVRLRTDCLDLLQLHNPISPTQAGSGLTPAVLHDLVLPAFQALQRAGKVRHIGISALGDSASVNEAIGSGLVDTAQVSYSLLDASAGGARADAATAESPTLLSCTRSSETGVIGIRLLAGGSLSGNVDRHPNALPKVVPMGQGIGSGHDYARDVDYARRFAFLVQEGHARSLVGAALRYGLSHPGIHTLAIGFSSRDQMEEAALNAADGPFDAALLGRIARVQEELGIGANAATAKS